MLEIEKLRKHFKFLKDHEFETEFYIALLLSERYAEEDDITEEVVEKIYNFLISSKKDSIFDKEICAEIDNILSNEGGVK